MTQHPGPILNLETIHAALEMVCYLDPEHRWEGASLPPAPGPGPRRHG